MFAGYLFLRFKDDGEIRQINHLQTSNKRPIGLDALLENLAIDQRSMQIWADFPTCHLGMKLCHWQKLHIYSVSTPWGQNGAYF